MYSVYMLQLKFFSEDRITNNSVIANCRVFFNKKSGFLGTIVVGGVRIFNLLDRMKQTTFKIKVTLSSCTGISLLLLNLYATRIA